MTRCWHLLLVVCLVAGGLAVTIGSSAWTQQSVAAAASTHAVTLSTAKIIAPEQGTAAYTVSLATAPTADVTITLAKANTDDANITFTPSTLTFTASNYSTAQQVTVAAADDADKLYGTATLTHTTASTDSNYQGLTADLAVSEGDNDVCQGTAAVNNATTGGLVDDCNTLLAAKTTLVGTATLDPDWATTTAIATWQGISVANSRVSQITLNQASLDGSIPNTFGNLTYLTSLYMNRNTLTGTIPASLGNLTKLIGIGINRNELTGTIPKELGNLRKLERLSIFDNDLTGTIPASLGNLTNLTWLVFSQNSLTGTIPTSLSKLTNLNTINFHTNELTGTIPASLGNLTKLENLHFHTNKLTGEIPPELGNLTKLLRIHIFKNSLSGTIPKELGNLSNLIHFSVQENDLSGSIPKELGNLTKLTWLTLNDNDLTGAIPKELSNLTSLEHLILQGNELTGDIPKELGNLTNLTQLTMDNNNLSGNIPKELGNLAKSNLQLTLYNNGLSGCIPPNLAQWSEGDDKINPQKDSQNNDVRLDVCHGIRLSTGTLYVYERLTATYTARLSSAPTGDVTVTLTEAGDNDITFSPATLTFTTTNHSTEQTVTLTAPADAVNDTGTAVITHTATSTDANYNNITTKLTAIEVDTTPILTAIGITQTTATLTIARHPTSWYYKANTGPDTTCKGPVNGRTAALTNLSPGTSYTYTAHSDGGCNTARPLTTARAFTTLSPPPPPYTPTLFVPTEFTPSQPDDPDTFYSGIIDGPDFCTNLSLGGPRTYAYDSDGDGVADVCSLPYTRREAIARQNALAALAANYPSSYAILLAKACNALDDTDHGDHPDDLAQDICAP